METKTCKECGRELEISNFKKTRWGGYVVYAISAPPTNEMKQNSASFLRSERKGLGSTLRAN